MPKNVHSLSIDQGTLPVVDSADIKAVRSSYPGRLANRLVFWTGIGILLLILTGKAEDQFRRLGVEPYPWLGYLLVFAFALAALPLLHEWYANRCRRRLQEMAVQASAEQTGYFRIGPYLDTPEDRKAFRRPDRADAKVRAWIETTASAVLCLTGDSGSGKSSLLNASVLPALRAHDWTVVTARAWQDPQAALREALTRPTRAPTSRDGEAPALRDLLQASTRRAAGKLLIVLDQFEEFIILGEPDRQREYAAFIADLLANPVKGLRLLLVLRSDYQSFIEEIGLPALRHGENFYQVGRFGFAVASDFLARSGLKLEPSAIDRLLTSAAELDETPGLVRPITLNVIGYVLSVGKTTAPSLDAGVLVRQYIEQTAGQPVIRDYAPRVLEQLITDQSTKRPRSEQDLMAAAGLRRGEIRGVLNCLADAALARPLDPAHGVWELSHDFVARAVARFLGRRRHDLLRQSAYYAAPALLIAALLSGAGLVFWSGALRDRRISELADLGFTINASDDGLAAAAQNSRLTNDNAKRAFSLLASLAGIVSLDLSGSDIESIEPISTLVSLRNLDLHGTRVASLDPLKSLSRLQILNVSGTKVSDLSSLQDLASLRSLNSDGTQIHTLEPLWKLIGLQSLNVKGTLVDDISKVSNLTRLRDLNVNSTKVGDLEPLKGLTELQTVDLGYTFVSSLQPLRDLPALQSLDISHDSITNFEPLNHMTKLRSLVLNGSNIASLELLREKTSLRSLDLSSTRVRDLEPLTALANLEELYLTDTAVDSIAPLKVLSKLSRLSFRQAKIDSLEPLRQLHALQWLDLGYSGRAYPVRLSLDPLKELTTLQFLDLSGTLFDTIDPLRNLTALRELSLVNIDGRLKSLEPIQDLPNLTTVHIWRNAVPDEEFPRFRRYREEKKLQPVAMK